MALGQLVSLAVKQLAANRVLAGVMALGIVVAAMLLAAAPIYSRAMADLGLTYAIRTELRGNANTRVAFFGVGLQTVEGKAFRASVEQRITERIGWFRTDQYRVVRLGRFGVARPGDPPDKGRLPQGEPQSLQGYESHVRVISGQLPAVTDGRVIEVAMSAAAADRGGLKVGDAFELREQFDNCERDLPTEAFPPPPPPCPITEAVAFTIPARLTAIIAPIAADDPFWVGSSGRYFEPFTLPIENVGAIVQMLTNEQTLLDGFGALYPAYRASTAWQVRANPERLTRTNFRRAHDDLVNMYNEFEPLGGYAVSPLRDTLNRFGRSADYQQTPLAVLLLEITGIALFYVGLVAAIVVERQAGEIALLRGRGATLIQVLSLYLVQGLIIGLPTLIAAPFLAAGVTALLGLTPLFTDVTDGELLPVTVVPLSFAMAAAGVALSLVALTLPALFAALSGATGVRRGLSRPALSVIQRYYLDVIFAAGAILLLIELRERGSVFTPSSTGGLSSDPLLLASPALAILAAGALILRFAPLLLRLVARATNVVSGAAVSLGLAQLVRNSGQYTRLTLLLMMAVAVGTFAASYTRTADRSYRDRANYEAGVDVRASPANGVPVSETERDAYEQNAAALPGVERASTVVRTTAAPAVAGFAQNQYQVLAIDPRAARQMLWFRDDLASISLNDLLTQIDGLPALPGKPLVGTPDTLNVWARSDDSIAGQTLRAGIRDAKGRYTLLPLVELEQVTATWTRFSAPIASKLFEPTYPLSLVALVVTGGANLPVAPVLFIDDITSTANAVDSSVDDFESPSQWAPFPTTASTPDTFEVVSQGQHGGKQAARFAFRQGASREQRGVFLSSFLTPIPAIVSSSFAGATGAALGQNAMLRVGGTLVPIVVRGTFDLFPSTHTRDGPVVVFNRDRLLAWRDIAYPGLGGEIDRNELWLQLKPGADLAAITNALPNAPFQLEKIFTRQEAIDANTRNPLIAASGSGILSAAFVAILALVAAALLTSLLAALRRRRVEIAVVRAIGLSPRQVLGMLTLEYAFVFAVGVSAGCLLGLFVSSRMLSFLDVTERGERVEPSFILETRWPVVGLGVLVVFAVFALALWLAARSVARSTDAAALRGE